MPAVASLAARGATASVSVWGYGPVVAERDAWSGGAGGELGRSGAGRGGASALGPPAAAIAAFAAWTAGRRCHLGQLPPRRWLAAARAAWHRPRGMTACARERPATAAACAAPAVACVARRGTRWHRPGPAAGSVVSRGRPAAVRVEGRCRGCRSFKRALPCRQSGRWHRSKAGRGQWAPGLFRRSARPAGLLGNPHGGCCAGCKRGWACCRPGK